MKESLFAQDIASRKGFLQSLDPRIKAITFVMLIIQLVLSRSLAVILCFYGLSLFLSRASRIGLGFFLKRTLFFVPLFSLFVVLPSIFTVFTPAEPILVIRMGDFSLGLSRRGLLEAVLFTARVASCVSFAVLLSITTRHFELLKVLRVFKVPQIFVMVLGMCYRYIYLFVRTVENTYLSVKSRIGLNIGYKKGRRIVAWNIAYLWVRSQRLNEDVYNAMLSRGYSGEPVLLEDFRAGLEDWLWILFVFGVLLSAVYYG